MTKPSEKSPEMEAALDKFTKAIFKDSMGRTDAIESGVCVICNGDASVFTDTLSKKEYTISGMCQSCQDDTFTAFSGED